MDSKNTMEAIKNFAIKYKTWLIIIGIIGVAVYTTITLKPDGYDNLYSNLSETDRQEIVVELSKLGVEYQIDETTQAIKVKKQDVSWVRKEMNDLGLPTSGEGAQGYDIFMENSLGSTKKDLELRELKARKGQLELELVRSFPFIDTATVNFDTPQDTSVFETETKAGKASVNIGFKSGSNVTPQQLLGIQHMVSSAIPGVNPEDVTVIDSKKGVISDAILEENQTMSSAYEKQLAIKSQTEQTIHDDIKRTLTTLFGYDSVHLNVNVAINFDEIVQNIENFDDEGVLRSRNGKTEDTVKVDGVENPEAGLDANGDVVGYDITAEDGNVVYQQKKEDIIENFEISKTVETVRKNPQLTNTNITVWVDQAKLEEKNIDVNQFRQAVGVASGLTFNQETDNFENGQVIIFASALEEIPEANEVAEQEEEKTGLALFLEKYGLFVIIGLVVLVIGGGIIVFLLMKKKKKERIEAEEAAIATAEALIKQQEQLQQQVGGNLQITIEDEVESSVDREIRVQNEKRHKELSEQVAQLSGEYPKETSDYIKKLLRERK